MEDFYFSSLKYTAVSDLNDEIPPSVDTHQNSSKCDNEIEAKELEIKCILGKRAHFEEKKLPN